MPSLTIVSSDNPTTLVERLAHHLGANPLHPFARETIVVQSRGTERWLRHQLARRHGCAASLDFPFAASFAASLASTLSSTPARARDALATTTRSAAARSDEQRERLTWCILDLLEKGLAGEDGFEPLRTFVGAAADRDTRKLLGLAVALTNRFEEYQLYRPDLVLAWESGHVDVTDEADPERWQAALWQRVAATQSAYPNEVQLHHDAIARLVDARQAPDGLPPRLSVVGVNTLPPMLVRMLHAVARHIPVHVYLHAPPRAAWSHGPTNPLAATFGGVTRELVALLEQHAPAQLPIVWEEYHLPAATAPAHLTLLAQLQSDIRNGLHRGPEAGLASPVSIQPSDHSLTIHRCHSPMREMEVLRDQLLAAMSTDPTLRPHDIIVLVPDVATYAPVVEAVFGVPEAGLPYIPHRIADRPIAQESRVADAALRILRLVGARCTAAEIVELLDLGPIQRAAGITSSAIPRILGWIEDTRIRWGRDGAMRSESFGLPAIEANSWRAGIDRLLMGYATGSTNELVCDVLPLSGDTIGDPVTLGAFAAFTERLFDTLASWRTPRPLHEWAATLRTDLTALLSADDENEAQELDVVLEVVDTLARLHPHADEARSVELPVVRDWLETLLADDSRSSGFLGGGMTVCALKPMRVVPHRIVAIAGLDDATFPRRHHRPAFDLIGRAPRAGDRSRRADDRQLFLDTLLAAGDRVILSYVARSAQDNTERAASVVVAELLDVIDRTVRHPITGTSARALVEVLHPLQPFSPTYFTGDRTITRLFSYSQVNGRALAARMRSGNTPDEIPFVDAPLAPQDDGVSAREVRLADLIRCWSNPSRFFCERALALRLAGADSPLDDCEPMSVSRLDTYALNDVMLHRHLTRTQSPQRDRAQALALGQLPSGALSGVWYDRIEREFAGFLASLGEQDIQEPLGIEVSGSSWTLSGHVDGITGSGRLQARPARCGAKDLIRAWITHLALTAAHGPVRTLVVGTRDDRCTFGVVNEPQTLLEALVEGYRTALREPLPFFTEASHAYAMQARKYEEAAASGKSGRLTRSPIAAALDAFKGREIEDYSIGDGNDPYVELTWRGRDPFAAPEQFDAWSLRFWGPALRALESDEAAS